MMDPSKINRPVATVDRNAWFLRFYLWLWAADIEKVDFCRLFWGYVFAIPFLLARLLILTPLFKAVDGALYMKRKGLPKVVDGLEWGAERFVFRPIGFVYRGIVKVARLIPEKEEKPEVKEVRKSWPKIPPIIRPYKPREPSKFVKFVKTMRESGGEAFLSSAAKTADKGVEAAQKSWPVIKWFFVAIGAVIAALLAGLCGYALWLLLGVIPVVLGAIWTAIIFAGKEIAWFFSTIFSSKYIWIVPLGIAAAIGLCMLIYAIIDSRPVKKAANKAANRTAKTTLSFGGAMKMGVKSVKYRTCPVIKVEGE